MHGRSCVCDMGRTYCHDCVPMAVGENIDNMHALGWRLVRSLFESEFPATDKSSGSKNDIDL